MFQIDSTIAGLAKIASKENTRYAIDGIYLDPKGEKGRAVATDGRRLAIQELKGKADDAHAVILHAKTLADASKRALTKPQERIGGTVHVRNGSPTACRIEGQQGESVTSSVNVEVIQGRFPSYPDVCPSPQDHFYISLNPAYLAECAAFVGQHCNEECKGVILAIPKTSNRPVTIFNHGLGQTKAMAVLMPISMLTESESRAMISAQEEVEQVQQKRAREAHDEALTALAR